MTIHSPPPLAISRRAAIHALLVLHILGCGGDFDSSVYGTVTLDGQPLATGTLSFHPTSGGPLGNAKIEDGSYEVHTGQTEGLPPGEYIVTVISRSKVTGTTPQGYPTTNLLTPASYADVKTSDLRATVQPGGNNIDFNLKK